jgi:hypothetical protein
MRGVRPAIHVPVELQERPKQGTIVPVKAAMLEMQGQMIAVSALALVRVLLRAGVNVLGLTSQQMQQQALLQVTIGGGGIVTSARLGRVKLIR